LAIVTGGARGIGRAICLALARDGADVVVADLNVEAAQRTAEEIKATGRKSLAVGIDVSSEESVKQLYGQVTAQFERVDILVNNAGICYMRPILETEVDEWNRVLSVNLLGTFLMSREAFRLMKEQRSGKIINIGSAAGKIGGVAAGAHYSASKAGVMCFTKSLALQAAPFKINVNAVCPGPTATEMTDAWGDDVNAAFAAGIPWREYGTPEDIAEAVAFLAGSKSKYITGEIIDVNGGLVMD
jgi:3-oxoacyl-[acyl-carrier protein] reductase